MAKSHFSDISTCLSITRDTLELLADTLKISGLEAILNTTDSLTKLTETIKQNKNVCNKLMEQTHQLLSAIVGVYIKSDTGGELPPSVLNHIAKFTQTLHKIHTFVEAQQGGNKVKKFLRQGELSSLLRDCKGELQQGLDFFQVTDIISEVKYMQEQAKARQQEVLDIIETLSSSDSASSISHVYSSSYASVNSISMLPAEPKIFHGRDTELAHILTLLVQQAPRIAILGAGGMGKTSLSRAVLHHSHISTKYGANRFFVACDGSTNKVELAGVIGAHFGLKAGKDLTQGVLQHLSSAPPTLLILDNLETLWDPIKSRKEIEEFLSLLTDIPTLALMITMRGAERPSKVQWTRPFLLPLQPLAREAAQKMFFDIADDAHSGEEVDKVLALTDNMPLVINLLAHLVDTEGCSEILSRWETKKTALLSDGYDKTSNLEISISLSLASPRVTSMPHSQDLLSLLSILPDGLSDVELKQASFPIEDILSCKAALLRTALAYTDGHKRLKVLVPIREYMQNSLPATEEMTRPLLKHFQELLELYREHVGKQSGSLSTSRIAANLSNIQNILRIGLHLGHPDLIDSIYCTCHLNRFSRIAGKGAVPLLGFISPMLPQLCDPRMEVYVITEALGLWTSGNPPITELIIRAEELINCFDDPEVKCKLLLSLKIILLTQAFRYFLYSPSTPQLPL
ncbi:P-loop containing nucleoside triphosphate hydrolase protein [Mycena alexandri]|uniref:P-loop containing nucleoside triphosphate hydrolase protein n=1 Tax=Mycena alexandri TaxID=1745969 RepID=A0AAD6S221_9AGAR|nr:P-loop containing nucleoside triphosphate hydrolase protein [Mycena alexandri]